MNRLTQGARDSSDDPYRDAHHDHSQEACQEGNQVNRLETAMAAACSIEAFR